MDNDITENDDDHKILQCLLKIKNSRHEKWKLSEYASETAEIELICLKQDIDGIGYFIDNDLLWQLSEKEQEEWPSLLVKLKAKVNAAEENYDKCWSEALTYEISYNDADWLYDEYKETFETELGPILLQTVYPLKGLSDRDDSEDEYWKQVFEDYVIYEPEENELLWDYSFTDLECSLDISTTNSGFDKENDFDMEFSLHDNLLLQKEVCITLDIHLDFTSTMIFGRKLPRNMTAVVFKATCEHNGWTFLSAKTWMVFDRGKDFTWLPGQSIWPRSCHWTETKLSRPYTLC